MHKQQEINSRKEYVHNLNEFLVSANNFVQDIFQNLNWTESATVKSNEKPLVTCPLDQGHRVSRENLDKHVEVCRWHQLGYRDDDVPFPPRPSKVPVSSVVIDKNLQREIILKAVQRDPSIRIGKNVHDREVAQTSDRFFSDFTSDERRVMYDYVISKTAGVMPELKEFNLTMKPEGQSAPMTREQLMAAERDAKRRRVKHRSKVHTKSKNYSEVLREVINNQMMAYEDWIKENFGSTNSTEIEEPEKKITEEANQEKQEMVWLDWDFRSNPHTRWKHIVEKEKRKKEREDKGAEISEKNGDKERDQTRNRDGRGSKRYHHREDFRKVENEDRATRDRYRHDRHHSRRTDEYERDDLTRRNESRRKDSHHSRHREDRYDEEYSKTKRYKSDRCEEGYNFKHKQKNEHNYGDEYKPKHKEKFTSNNGKEAGKKVDYYKETTDKSFRIGKNVGSYESNSTTRVKEENNGESSFNYIYKSSDTVRLKNEEDSDSTNSYSLSDSSLSSSSSDSMRVKKQKKSKKKHKHKHKKKRKKDRK